MKESRYFMIDLYLERERIKHLIESEMYNMEVLMDFFKYHRKIKGKGWNIDDLFLSDRNEYCDHLGRPPGQKAFVERKIGVIEDFLNFAVVMGWLNTNPWREL